MSPPILQLRGVKAGFGRNLVLHGIALAIEEGATVGLFGLNGAGKSVTMKVMTGLVPLRHGTVTLDGHDVSAAPPEDRVALGLGYVPQGRQIFPKLSVEQNLRLGGYLVRRRDKSRYDTSLTGIYQRFPRLAERRNQHAGSLSGGEQAMLAIARALIGEPRVLLIDEPSAGLAPAVVEEVASMLRALRDEGLTMVLVEQNITFGLRLVERAVILQRGRIVYDGRVEELDTSEVARLLGVGRLLGGQLEQLTSPG